MRIEQVDATHVKLYCDNGWTVVYNPTTLHAGHGLPVKKAPPASPGLVLNNAPGGPPMYLANAVPILASDTEPLRVPTMNFDGPEPLVYAQQPVAPYLAPAAPVFNYQAEEPLALPVLTFNDSPVASVRGGNGGVQAGSVPGGHFAKNSGVGAAVSDDSQPLPLPCR